MASDSKASNETVQSGSCNTKEAPESIESEHVSNKQCQISDVQRKEVSEEKHHNDLPNEELQTGNSYNQMGENLSNQQPPTDTCSNQTKEAPEGIGPGNLLNLQAQTCDRINDQVYNFLKNLLETNLSRDTENTEPIPIDTQLHTALQFLNTGKYQEAESTENISHCLTNFINCLIEVAPQFIKFPDPEEAVNVQKQFYYLGEHKYNTGFPNVLGVIDCTHVLLQTPSIRPEIYINRHSHHSINVQIVCGPDLQIYNVLAAFPGGMEDACIWQCSNLRNVVSESDANNGWLIGDLNYPQEPWLMTPLPKPKSRAEKLYNKIHSRTWNPIQECIGLLKSKFGCLQSVLNYEPKKVCAIVTACCVLHNICLQFNDVVEIDPNLKKAQIADMKQIITVDSMEEGVIARNDLIKNNLSN